MGGSAGSQGGSNDKGSNYSFSRTSSGQGNWNTGREATGTGSMARGIVGINDARYNVAPDRFGPGYNAGVLKSYQNRLAAAAAARQPVSLGAKDVTPGIVKKVQLGVPVPGLSPEMLAQIQAFLDKPVLSPPNSTTPVTYRSVAPTPRNIAALLQGKQFYDRMPEYDRIPGYDSPWTAPRPRMGNNLIDRTQGRVGGGRGGGGGDGF